MLDKNKRRILIPFILVASLQGCSASPGKIVPASQVADRLSYASSTPRHWDTPYKPFPAINKEMPVEGNIVPSLSKAEQQANKQNASAKTKFYYGLALYQAGQYNGAVRVMRSLMPENPHQQDLYKWTGYALIGTGDLKQAADMFGHFADMKAVSRQNSLAARVEQGNCFWEMGCFDKAVEAYNTAFAADWNNAAALMGLTDIALRQGNSNQAGYYLKQLARIPPDKRDNSKIALLRHRLETGT